MEINHHNQAMAPMPYTNGHCNSSSSTLVDQMNLSEDWQVLGSVYEWLRQGKAFPAQNPNEEKIVEYIEPHELKKLIDLKIEEHSKLNAKDIANLCQKVIKYSVKTSHGRFHNQLFGQLDPYGLAGTWISEGLNTSAYTFEVAPVFSLIETELVQKVCQIAGYDQGDGICSPGGSISNMYALVLARYKRYPQVKSSGMFGLRPLVLFTSEEAHYSLKKASHWLGLGMDNCVVIKTNQCGQMLLEDLENQIKRVKAEGREPFFVNATAGTTVLGAFDDFHQIANICERYGLWLHIDACLGGSAMLSYHNRHLLAGIERSNSFSWNPHKTLGAPLQCALFITRENGLLAQSNALQVQYLFQQDKFYDISYDTGNKSVQCGRKIDAFKFWLMLKARGYGGFGRLVDHAIDMAQRLTEKIQERSKKDGSFRLVLPHFQFTNICFWYIPKKMRDVKNKESAEWWQELSKVAPKIKEQMIRQGTLMVGYSPLSYRNVVNFFRLVLSCFPIMDEAEIDFMLNEIERLGEEA